MLTRIFTEQSHQPKYIQSSRFADRVCLLEGSNASHYLVVFHLLSCSHSAYVFCLYRKETWVCVLQEPTCVNNSGPKWSHRRLWERLRATQRDCCLHMRHMIPAWDSREGIRFQWKEWWSRVCVQVEMSGVAMETSQAGWLVWWARSMDYKCLWRFSEIFYENRTPLRFSYIYQIAVFVPMGHHDSS